MLCGRDVHGDRNCTHPRGFHFYPHPYQQSFIPIPTRSCGKFFLSPFHSRSLLSQNVINLQHYCERSMQMTTKSSNSHISISIYFIQRTIKIQLDAGMWRYHANRMDASSTLEEWTSEGSNVVVLELPYSTEFGQDSRKFASGVRKYGKFDDGRWQTRRATGIISR